MAYANPRIRNLEIDIPDAIPDEPEEDVEGETELVFKPAD